MASIPTLKPPQTIDQQIELLKIKGLIINDKDVASLFLIDNNYYRLNVYFHKLMDKPDHFIPGIDFSIIINICRNDCYLRKQIFSMLEPIEIKIKATIAYFVGCKYGPDAFYKKDIYQHSNTHDKITQSFNKEISRREKDPIVIHHREHYAGYFPIWVIVEFLTFNNISKFYANLKPEDQKNIALDYFGISERYLVNWFHSLSVMRNICAHYGYLYRRMYSVPVSFGNDSSMDKSQGNTLTGIFYCIKKLSKKDQWTDFYNEIYNTLGEKILIDDYCLPSDLSKLKN